MAFPILGGASDHAQLCKESQKPGSSRSRLDRKQTQRNEKNDQVRRRWNHHGLSYKAPEDSRSYLVKQEMPIERYGSQRGP